MKTPQITSTGHRALRLLGACLLGLGLALQSAWAADLMEIYDLARNNDPALRAAEAARRAAIEAKPQARALLLPNVGLRGDVSREMYDPRNPQPGEVKTFSTNQNYTLSVNQPVYRWDRIVQLRQADSQVAQAEAEYRAAEQALMVRAAERYFGVLAAIEDLRFAQAERDAIARQKEQAEQRFDVGLIAITDVLEARAGYDLAVSSVVFAENQLESAKDALREVIGELPGKLQQLTQALELLPPDPASMDAWVQRAKEHNLQIIATRAAVEAARREIERRRAGHHPTLDLNASYTYRDLNFGGIYPLERDDSSIALQLNIPIYQGGLVSSQTRQAAERYMEAKERLEEQWRQIERQTRDAYRGVVNGIAQVKALRQALASTETAVKAAEAGFEVGTRTMVDVLNTQRERFRSQRNLARARFDYLLSILRLKQAAGSLSPDDVAQINAWLR